MKICEFCGEQKPKSEFYKHKNGKAFSKCKVCYAPPKKVSTKPKTYKDYLREAGLEDYYNRTSAYRSFM